MENGEQWHLDVSCIHCLRLSFGNFSSSWPDFVDFWWFFVRDFASDDMKRKADLSVVCFSVVVVVGLDTIVLLLLLCGNTMMAHQHLIVSPFIFFSFIWCPFDGLEWRHSVKRDIPIPVFLFLLSGVSRSNQTPNHRAHLLIVLIDS